MYRFNSFIGDAKSMFNTLSNISIGIKLLLNPQEIKRVTKSANDVGNFVNVNGEVLTYLLNKFDNVANVIRNNETVIKGLAGLAIFATVAYSLKRLYFTQNNNESVELKEIKKLNKRLDKIENDISKLQHMQYYQLLLGYRSTEPFRLKHTEESEKISKELKEAKKILKLNK